MKAKNYTVKSNNFLLRTKNAASYVHILNQIIDGKIKFQGDSRLIWDLNKRGLVYVNPTTFSVWIMPEGLQCLKGREQAMSPATEESSVETALEILNMVHEYQVTHICLPGFYLSKEEIQAVQPMINSRIIVGDVTGGWYSSALVEVDHAEALIMNDLRTSPVA
jgi:hypothetical protein